MILMRYILGHVEHTARTRDHIPAKQDWIRIGGDVFEVTRVLWIEDSDRPEVQIFIAEV